MGVVLVGSSLSLSCVHQVSLLVLILLFSFSCLPTSSEGSPDKLYFLWEYMADRPSIDDLVARSSRWSMELVTVNTYVP